MKHTTKFFATTVLMLLISAASVLLSPSVSAWHKDGVYSYSDYEASNQRYVEKLPSVAREAVKDMCVFHVRYIDEKTGFVNERTGLGEGCGETHLDETESFVNDIRRWSRWVERTPHYQKAIRSTVYKISVDWNTRNHISAQDMEEYLDYARKNGKYAPAIYRLLFAEYPVSCETAKLSARTRFSEGEELYGWIFSQTENIQKDLAKIAEYICARWDWFYRTVPWSPYGVIEKSFVDTVPEQCYIPVVVKETETPEIVWRGQCFKGMFGGYRGHYWMFTSSNRLHGQRLDKSAFTALATAIEYSQFPDGRVYEPKEYKHVVQVLSVVDEVCVQPAKTGCEAWNAKYR